MLREFYDHIYNDLKLDIRHIIYIFYTVSRKIFHYECQILTQNRLRNCKYSIIFP